MYTSVRATNLISVAARAVPLKHYLILVREHNHPNLLRSEIKNGVHYGASIKDWTKFLFLRLVVYLTSTLYVAAKFLAKVAMSMRGMS